MAVVTKKYNPGFLSDDELIESFCVREAPLESIVETLRENTGASNQHVIVIGRRGSGKTSLLLRVAVEARRDAELSACWFPIVFAEESYEVGTCGEFWLECLFRLSSQAPEDDHDVDLARTFEDLRTEADDTVLENRCLGAILDYSDRTAKRLLLVVENLNTLLADIPKDDAWRLRKTLQVEPRVMLLASATSRFDAIDNADQAMYDLFRDITLKPLDTNECAKLWQSVSGNEVPSQTIRSLEILTGGSPRMLAIVAKFGSGLSFHELMTDLLDLVDDHTEYFKNHLESLPSKERRVYLALADLWMPATAKEIATRARFQTNECSALLNRLINRGAVATEGGSARRKEYVLVERLYNIYYLLRRHRGQDRMVDALVGFMTSYYSGTELAKLRERLVNEAATAMPEAQTLEHAAMVRLLNAPEMAEDRERLLAIAPERLRTATDTASHRSDGMKSQSGGPPDAVPHSAEGLAEDREEVSALYSTARGLIEAGRGQEGIVVCDEIVGRFGGSDATGIATLVAMALFDKGVALGTLDRSEEEIATYDDLVERFGDSDATELATLVAKVLVNKGFRLRTLDRSEEAIAVCNEVVERFGESDAPEIATQVAMALFGKAVALGVFDRSEEEIAAYDDLVERFGDSDATELATQVAMALFNKGVRLATLDRSEEAITVYDEIVGRFGDGDATGIVNIVAMALLNKGVALRTLDRTEAAIAVSNEVVERFGENDATEIATQVAAALFHKGVALGLLDRPEEEIAVYDEAVERFGESDAAEIATSVAKALFNKGFTLQTLKRSEEAAAVYDEVVERFANSTVPSCIEVASGALAGAAVVHLAIGQLDKSIDFATRALATVWGTQLQERAEALGTRAAAHARNGDEAGSQADLEEILSLVPELKQTPKEVIDTLISCSIELGASRVLHLIENSNAPERLLPLVTALQQEIGETPRVALEVSEVARDIRADMAKRRTSNSVSD